MWCLTLSNCNRLNIWLIGISITGMLRWCSRCRCNRSLISTTFICSTTTLIALIWSYVISYINSLTLSLIGNSYLSRLASSWICSIWFVILSPSYCCTFRYTTDELTSIGVAYTLALGKLWCILGWCYIDNGSSPWSPASLDLPYTS